MTELAAYLEQSALRDADGTWKWADNQLPVPMLGRNEVAEFVKELPDRSNVKLLPVRTWGRVSGSFLKSYALGPDPEFFAEKLHREHGIPVNKSTYKLNYTNNTQGAGPLRKPSIFVSPENGEDQIKPGDRFILVDDNIETMGTLRDMIRHINNCGGTVIGFIETGMDKHLIGSLEEGREMYAEMICERIWQLERQKEQPDAPPKSREDSDRAWRQLPESERSDFVQKVRTSANEHLKSAGLTFDQLAPRELQFLHYRLQRLVERDPSRSDVPKVYHSMDDFWSKQVSDKPYPWPIPIAEIKNVQSLSDQLGTTVDAVSASTSRFIDQMEQRRREARKGSDTDMSPG